LLTQPKRNAGRHGNPNNVRSNKVDTREE